MGQAQSHGSGGDAAGPSNLPLSGATTVTLNIPKAQHGRIIGPGGSTISSLRAETGALVDVPPKASPTTTITIRGSPAAVSAATARIHAMTGPDRHSASGERFRASASAAGVERARLAAAAAAAYERGDRAEAHRLSVASKAAAARADAATAAAASAIYEAANAGRGRHEVDLHGLTMREAVSVATRRLNALQQGERVRLITGAGHHSGPGGPKIRPAVEELLRTRRARYVAEGPGAFVVTGGERREGVGGWLDGLLGGIGGAGVQGQAGAAEERALFGLGRSFMRWLGRLLSGMF
ncbi:hypothetical protein MMPV_001195 [Pyropia vietnamensis]